MSPGEIISDPQLDRDAPLTWSTGAMTAAGFAAVCAEVVSRDRPSVVACGSGFSTLKLAALIHERGGRLVSLEHDELWAARVRRNLADAGFAETAHVTLAPLEPHPLARGGLLWYAEYPLRSLPRRIDVLLIDGPPAFEPEIELSRYPALPALAERLAADAIVLLDDIDRRGELQILEAWERECGFRFEIRPAERIAVGRRSRPPALRDRSRVVEPPRAGRSTGPRPSTGRQHAQRPDLEAEPARAPTTVRVGRSTCRCVAPA